MKSALVLVLVGILLGLAATRAAEGGEGFYAERSVLAWAEDLARTKGVAERRAAAQALLVLGEEAAPAVERILEATGDESREIRLLATESLGRIGVAVPGAVVTRLGELVADADEEVVGRALMAIAEIGPAADVVVPRAVGVLGGKHVDAAAHALARIGTPAAWAAVMARARSGRVTNGLLEAFGGSGQTDAIPVLELAASSSDVEIAATATIALLSYGREAADEASPIAAALDSADATLRVMTLVRLARVGVRPALVPSVLRLLQDTDVDVRREAIRVVRAAQVDDGGMVTKALLQSAALERNEHVKVDLIEALGFGNLDLVAPELLRWSATGDEVEFVATSAALARASRSERMFVPVLTAALASSRADVRRRAVRGLGVFAPSSEVVRHRLTETSRGDEDAVVRAESRWVLREALRGK